MNENSIVQPPEGGRQGAWLDNYMPETAMAPYGPPGGGAPRQQFFNFAAMRGIIYRQRWLVGAVIVLALLAGLLSVLMATPVYQSTAKVSVKPYGQSVVAGQDTDPGFNAVQIYDYLSTQVEVIKSRSLAAAVVADLKLASRGDLLGKDIDQSRTPGMSDEKWQKAKEEMAISLLADSVVVDDPAKNWVLKINFQSTSPTLAAEIANGYADAFVATGSRNSIENNRYAVEYLKAQIDETRQRLAEAEQVSNSYARNSGIIVQSAESADGSGGGTLTSTNLRSLNERAASARVTRIEAEQRWRAVQRLPAAELPEVQANPALQLLIADRTAKNIQLVELRQRYQDDFPQIQTLLAQVKALDVQIERSATDVKAAARSQFIVAQGQEQALQAELNSLTDARLTEQDQQVELSALDREAVALRDQLKSLLDRYNQINSATNLDPGTITKIDPAMVPDAPFSPNIPRNLGIALVLGIALAAALAVLRETLDDRIRSLEDVEEKVGLALLGHTPYVEDRDLDTKGSNRFSSLIEAYSSIRAAIDFTLPRNRNVIQFTSSQAGEGKSTTAVILAELFASMGRRTLLVDADMRRPSVASLLDLEAPKVGTVEVILGHVELESAVVKGVHENLEILPMGKTPPNPTEILASREMQAFIERYRNEYSLIIFDSCPVMGLADAPTLGNLVDGTVFILEANRLPFGQARAAVRRLGVAGGNIIGVVLTKYRALEAGQSYNYQYGYYEYGREK